MEMQKVKYCQDSLEEEQSSWTYTENTKTLKNLLLLQLSHFSHVQLCETPQMAAYQAPPSLGFSRQEHWSGLPFPSSMHEVKSEREVAQSCLTLRDPMDCSLPGSFVHGIFQARVLEWVTIAFSLKNLLLIIITHYCLGTEQIK